ncbi:MAG: transketolase [Spirochaetales bacterium]|nr:transketolase [Spirochaetales bacterium]
MNSSDLKKTAARLRLDVMEMVFDVQDGHPGPAFSVAEIITALYFGGIMNIRPHDPLWNERDRFVLSKGHACPLHYAALARSGFFPTEELFSLRKIDSRLQGHPFMGKTPGNDGTTGSLGNGLATAVGMAKGLVIQKKESKVFCIIGDGECNEGIIWESVMAAANLNLSNLTVFLDNNLWQSGGSVEAVSGICDFQEKFETFGWNTLCIDGHSFKEIISAVQSSRPMKDKPTVIICSTVKGKGLPFMENDNSWHKRVPTQEQMDIAREILGKEAV